MMCSEVILFLVQRTGLGLAVAEAAAAAATTAALFFAVAGDTDLYRHQRRCWRAWTGRRRRQCR